MTQESREVELLTEPTTQPPDALAPYVAVQVPGQGEQWLKLATDSDVTDAEMDFRPAQ